MEYLIVSFISISVFMYAVLFFMLHAISAKIDGRPVVPGKIGRINDALITDENVVLLTEDHEAALLNPRTINPGAK